MVGERVFSYSGTQSDLFIQHYFNGWKNNDAISMAVVLHPKGKWFVRSDRNDLREIEQQRVAANIKDNARRGTPKLGGEMRIVSVDVTEDVAVVKVAREHASAEDPKLLEQLLVKGTRITEYLSLMRIGDGWRIVGKVENIEELKTPLKQTASR